MGQKRTAKIKRLNAQDAPDVVQKLADTVGENTMGDANLQIAAKGNIAFKSAENLRQTIKDDINGRNASISLNGIMHKSNEDTAKDYNVLAATMEIEDPNNPDNWKAKGFPITETEVVDLPAPGIVENGSVTNGDVLGTADIHHDPTPTAKDYTHRVTKGDPADDSTYIDVVDPKSQYSKSSNTINVPAAYWNVPLFWKTTAHNNTGPGIESKPYGGGRINGK